MATRSTAHTVAPEQPIRPPAVSRALRTAQDGSPSSASPARILQDSLGARLLSATEADGRWSARRTLAFAVCASAALWGGIAAGGFLLLRA